MPHIEKLRKALVGNESREEMGWSSDRIASSLILQSETASTYVFRPSANVVATCPHHLSPTSHNLIPQTSTAANTLFQILKMFSNLL